MTTYGIAEEEIPEGINQNFSPEAIKEDDVQRTRSEKLTDLVTYGTPSVFAGFVDTLGQSFGLLDDDDMAASIRYMAKEWGDYYSRNKETARTVGDLTGMFIPGMAGIKAIRGGSWLNKLVKGTFKSNLMDSVFTSGRRWDSVRSRLNAAHLYTARRQVKDLKGLPGVDFDDINKASVVGKFGSKGVVNRVARERITDSVKEVIAFESVVATTMNESDTLYPDEFTMADHLIFSGLVPSAFIGIEKLMLNRAIRHSRQFAKSVASLENADTLSFADLITRPGIRGDMLTLQGVKIVELETAKATRTSADSRKTINSAILSLQNEMRHQMVLSGKDNPLGGWAGLRGTKITNSVAFDEGSPQIRTMMTANADDPTTFIGLLSTEKLPETVQELSQIVKRKHAVLANLDGMMDELRLTIPEGELAPDNIAEQLTKLQTYKDEVESLEYFVLEASGELVLAVSRKPLYQDGVRKIRTQRETQVEPRTFIAEISADPITGGNVAVMGVTEDLLALLPQIEKETISGINVTKIVEKFEDLKSPENFRLLLKDMGEDWHYQTGARGQAIFKTLPQELQSDIKDWTGSSSSSNLRKWAADNDPRFRQIYDAYSPVRARLRELADNDGTIPLMRGESRRENVTEGVKNDVVSMTSSPVIAKNFGAQIIVRRVPVEDVIMIVGGLGKEFEFIVKGNSKRILGATKQITNPLTKSSFEALTLYQRSALYASYQHAVTKYRVGNQTIHLSVNDHHTRLDASLELLASGKPGVENDIKLPATWKSLDDIEYNSLASKYTEYFRMRQMNDAIGAGKVKVANKQLVSDTDYPKMFNLPTTNNGDMHPVLEMFEMFYQAGETDFKMAIRDMAHVKNKVMELAHFPEITSSLGKNEITFRGRMMNIPENQKPVLLIKKPLSTEMFTREATMSRAIMAQAHVMEMMAKGGSEGAPLTQFIFETIEGTGVAPFARDVNSLSEGIQRSSGFVTTGRRSVGESPTMQAMHDVETATDRLFREQLDIMFEPHNSTFSKLRAKNNIGDLEVLNLFVHARREGWDLEEAFVENVDGTISFALKESQYNLRRWKELYGTEMQEGALMPAATRINAEGFRESAEPIAVTAMAFDGIKAIRKLGLQSLNETRYLQRMAGRGAIGTKEWWVPPKNFADKEFVILLDESGKMRAVVDGRTKREASSKALKEIDASEDTLYIATRENVRDYDRLLDKAFVKMLDLSDPLNQSARSRGTSVGNIIETGPGVLNGMIDSLTRNFNSNLRRTRALYFESSVNQARMARQIATPPNAATGSDIWSKYISSVYGNPTINPNDVVGKVYTTINDVYDNHLMALIERYKIQPNKVNAAQKSFTALRKSLGEHNPFNDVADYASRTFNVKPPMQLKQHMAKLNQVTSLLTLRLLELGHPILNMTSLAATMPGVVAALKMTADEAAGGAVGKEIWKARIGALASFVDNDTAVFNPTRAITSGIHFMFTPEGHKVWDAASKQGWFKQDVAEIMKTITAPREGYAESMFRKSTDMLSVLSDKSEVLARAISFMTGYNIAKKGLSISKDSNAFVFAHRFANQVIGDYRPHNRPKIFQGAVGMPLGLFQTFVWNYYERLLSYIENGQVRALAIQFAMQASVFGGKTVPGFDQFNDFFASNYDGTINPAEGFRNKFGDDVTDWVMSGTLSNLPKLFGADDGIALYSRGDVTMQRVPGVWNVEETPGVSLIRKIGSATAKIIQSLRTNGGVNSDQIAEILANHSINRPMRNALEMYLGYSTDKRGGLIEDDVRTTMGIAARIVSMRPMRETKTQEAFSKIRSTQFSQRAKTSELRDMLRSKARSGSVEMEDIEGALNQYMKYGGNASGFVNFLVQQFVSGTTEKAQLEVIKALKDKSRSYDVLRLLSVLDYQDIKPLNEVSPQ